MEKNKYWDFKALANNEADLYLYVEIANWGGGYVAHSAQSFKDELDGLGNIDTLNIYINSPGGDVFEGNTILNMLKRKKCTKNVYVDGLAASIASVIAMAGDKIIMPSNSMMMIHNAWTYTAGNSNELRETADMLDKINTSIRQTYLEKANGKVSEDDLIKLMDAETWLTAQEALDYGLCDEVVTSKDIAAKYKNDSFKNYKNVPKAFFVEEKQEKTDSVMDEATKILIQRIKNL